MLGHSACGFNQFRRSVIAHRSKPHRNAVESMDVVGQRASSWPVCVRRKSAIHHGRKMNESHQWPRIGDFIFSFLEKLLLFAVAHERDVTEYDVFFFLFILLLILASSNKSVQTTKFVHTESSEPFFGSKMASLSAAMSIRRSFDYSRVPRPFAECTCGGVSRHAVTTQSIECLNFLFYPSAAK